MLQAPVRGKCRNPPGRSEGAGQRRDSDRSEVRESRSAAREIGCSVWSTVGYYSMVLYHLKVLHHSTNLDESTSPCIDVIF